MKLLMETLVKKLRIREDGGYNLEVSLEGESSNMDEPKRKSNKEHEKEQPSSSVMNH